MGYWDTFTANLFQQDTQGRRTYSPLGKLGKSYLVPDEAKNEIVRATQRRYKIMFGAIIGTQLLFGWRFNLLLAPGLLVWFFMASVQNASNLEVISGDKIKANSRLDSLRRNAEATGSRTLTLLLLMSLAFVAMGIFIVSAAGEPAGWYSIFFFGLCASVFAAQLLLSKPGR